MSGRSHRGPGPNGIDNNVSSSAPGEQRSHVTLCPIGTMQDVEALDGEDCVIFVLGHRRFDDAVGP